MSGVNSKSGSPWRRQVPFLVVLVVAGVALAFVWRALTPAAAGLGDEQEANAAVDGSLALLGMFAGALTSSWVLIWPGSSPGRRCLAAIAGSAVAGAIAWQLGDLLGTPALRAFGAAFTWPVATSAGLFFGALLPGTSRRLVAAGQLDIADSTSLNADSSFSADGRSEPYAPR